MSLILQNARTLRPAALPALAWSVAPLLAAIAVAFLLQKYAPLQLGPYQVRVMLDVGIAIILAVSLNIVNGFTGQFSIGHGGFLAVGGYSAALVTYYTSMAAWGGYEKQGGFLGVGECLLLGGCVVGGVAAAITGYVVGLPSLRLRGDYLAIVTLGFGEILRTAIQLSNAQLFDADELKAATWRQLIPPPVGGAQGFSDIPKYTNLFWVYLFVGITLLFSFRLKRSSTGRALLSIREDEIAAQAMGVNITQLKVRAFVFAAFFAGIAGALYAHQSGTVLQPLDAGFQRSFDVIIMVVLGGMGSISGAALAAILLTIASEWLREPTTIWCVAIYAPLIRIALTQRESWRDLATIAAATAVLELARWQLGAAIVLSSGGFAISLVDVAYAALLLAFLAIRRDTLRGVATIFAVVIGFEIIRVIAVRFSVNLGDYRMIVYALLLVLMMIFRPQGLFGVAELWDFLPGRRAARGAAA